MAVPAAAPAAQPAPEQPPPEETLPEDRSPATDPPDVVSRPITSSSFDEDNVPRRPPAPQPPPGATAIYVPVPFAVPLPLPIPIPVPTEPVQPPRSAISPDFGAVNQQVPPPPALPRF